MDRLISEQAIEKALKQNTVLGEFIEKQVEKNIKMREYWTNVFSNELIDRMSVIRAINDAYDETDDKESYRDKVTHKMMAIPSAEPKWIPVSERLPENSDRYLAYIINRHDDKLRYIMTCDYSADGYWNWFPDDECASDNVIAWMPLPPCYEPQERSE